MDVEKLIAPWRERRVQFGGDDLLLEIAYDALGRRIQSIE